MAQISERQLLAQLRESVGLLAAAAAEQERWLDRPTLPCGPRKRFTTLASGSMSGTSPATP